MKKLLRNNGLSIAFMSLFLVTWLLGQTIAGLNVYNEEQRDHGHSEITFIQYLSTSHFGEATAENWESEFLQMFLFVVLTSFLYQKGSAESKDPDKEEEVDDDPQPNKKAVPWPVRKGGWALRLYKYSLSIALLAIFLISFALHAINGAGVYNEEQQAHGNAGQVTALQYVTKSQFWFESFQNWQSEFLSVGAMVILSVYLRHKGSPESKPVDAPHSETGK